MLRTYQPPYFDPTLNVNNLGHRKQKEISNVGINSMTFVSIETNYETFPIKFTP